jgi:hypothetical protein
MALRNTINFLPEAFRSTTNQRFLGATMDQLVTDAYNVPVNGYVGRRFAPTYKTGDNYVPETTADRSNYQLEPSVVVKNDKGEVTFTADYLDLLQSIKNNSGFNANHSRLFTAESYNYDGHFDYDKFVNYNNYYWLPDGPAPVSVTSGATPTVADYTVTRNTAVGGYTFGNLGGHPNTQITLVRGGTYTFTVNQPGSQFWIQSFPGTSGLEPNIPTISTRAVYGVSNNGTDNGTVRFNVPLSTAQDFYTSLPITATVNAAVDFDYTKIQNRLLSEFLTEYPDGLDGVNNLLQNKTFVFVGNSIDNSLWTTPALPAGFTGSDTSAIRPGSVITGSARTSVWQIDLIPSGSDYLIQIRNTLPVAPLQKVFIGSGKTYASRQFWLDTNYRYTKVPAITASADYLYYQDSTSPGFVGTIKLVDNKTSLIDVTNDILGKSNYTSPNGVVFTNGLKVQFDSLVVPANYANNQYYVEGVGTSITLVPVDQLTVPSQFTDLIKTTPDYLTINRGSLDRNTWSQTNRWFHKDVLSVTAKYNNTTVDYGPNIAGRRAIIEFEPNLQLYNYGQQAINNIDILTFNSTNAFVNIEGQVSYTLEGVALEPGMRIVFANDYDPNTVNNIWLVDFQLIHGINFIRLLPTTGDPVQPGQNLQVTQGYNANQIFRFDGSAWHVCQAKTEFNQAPLFDLVDADGYSFSNTTVYPDSTFAGTKFFSYANGTGNYDSVLTNIRLKYQNFNNIGDIVFENHYETDSFTYTHNGATVTKNCSTGYLQHNLSLTESIKLNDWVKSVRSPGQYQIFTKFYDGYVLPIGGKNYSFVQIDVLPNESGTVPNVKVFLNNTLLNSSTDYQFIAYGVYHAVTLNITPAVGDKIDVLVFSNSQSATGYYEVPENLDFNPLNEPFSKITLGQLRNHYNKLIENTSRTTDTAIPQQDRYLKAQGGTLLQQTNPVIYAMTMLTDPAVNFVNGITLARKEYTKFKNKFLTLCNNLQGLDYNNPIAGVDAILQNINFVKNISFPWYYSDMVPQGSDFNAITYTVLNARQTNYEIGSLFNNTVLSNRAVLVYLNGVQLTLGTDYTFSTSTPAIIFSRTLTVGDTILIRDYVNTDGNFIPETPTKLGLYPKFEPILFVDNTYQTPITVIRGHDGSITPAFGDFRDNYLLELERRIYNNIKTDYSKNVINLYDIVPGRFRSTDYNLAEWNQILTKNFLQWAGSHNIDYTSNRWYDANNTWTWNYDQFKDSVDGSYLQGSWRAIYNYWYDTDTPHLTPWVMLGFGARPAWWITRYGPAPYTGSNGTLWEDLQAGYVWNNGNSYTDKRFARPGLLNFIPVDSAGNLRKPIDIGIIKEYNSLNTSNSFKVGEQGPVETAWRRSSDYPFSLQLAVATAKPADYFATQIDTSRFFVNSVTKQFSNVDNQRLNPGLIVINGDTTLTPGTVSRASGYMNWIADSIKNIGIDPITTLKNYFKNFSVQLTYKVGGYTDQNLIRVSAEQTSPGSTNASVIIPNQNYKVYFGNPVTTRVVTYSGVIVTRTANGYSVSGYDTANPFFNVLPSVADNNYSTITAGTTSAKIYQTTTGKFTPISYGTTFNSVQQLVDFLVSYQRYLVSEGFVFNTVDSDLQTTRDWILSAQEFLFWAQQSWAPGTIIVLNPVFDSLAVNSIGTVVDQVTNLNSGGQLLDTNFEPIKNSNFNVLRVDSAVNGNQFRVSTLDGRTPIAFAKLNQVQFENVLVFDNVDSFGDILYIPNQGTRQYRLKINGTKTGGWDGALSPAGYIYSNPVINAWQPGADYRQGDIVTYNNNYYTAIADTPASQQFNISFWTPIPQSAIQTGLLPSFGYNAQVFQNIYDVDNPPQDQNYQLFSSGLIGFRERPFLSNLGLSVSTQTKFYQGYIKQKGTANAIDALTKATFDNVTSPVSTYEEWAFRVGTYGDVDSNEFREFVLDQSVFTNNPVAFTLTTNTYSNANVIVDLTLANIYNASNLSSTSTALYNTRTSNVAHPTDLITAGYVNVADVDYQIFDISAVSQIPTLKVGNKIWVAKDTNRDWNVYRVNEIPATMATTLTYTLDSYAQLTFTNPHNLAIGNYFVLQNFNTNFDGLYQVIGVPNQLSVTVQLTNPAALIKTNSKITGQGTVYRLDSVVVDSILNVDTIAPLNNWINGDRVWVNNATSQGWGVYTFTRPWSANSDSKLTSNTVTTGAQFGTSVRIGQYLYVGSPGDRTVKIINSTNPAANVTVSTADTQFGSVVETCGNLVAVASQTNVHIYQHQGSITPVAVQTLVSANIAQISSVSISQDATWLYVGDSTNNLVEAYYSANIGVTPYTWMSKITGTAATRFGAQIKTNATGNVVIVGAPDATGSAIQSGNVYVYTQTANVFALAHTITSHTPTGDAHFGTCLDLDSSGGNLFVGAPGAIHSGSGVGAVERYVYTGGQYEFNQSFIHPNNHPGAFGTAVRIQSNAQTLAIGSSGDTTEADTTFDHGQLTIDAGTTYFAELVPGSGSVYVFEPIVNLVDPKFGQFSYVQELIAQVSSGDNFGSSIDMASGTILVGAPGSTNNAGNAHTFTSNPASTAWTLTRQQTPAVDISTVNRIFVYNKTTNVILSAVDYIDPAKGKILNAVGVDIDYQSGNDPAVYNKGTSAIQSDFHWGPTQVGKVWWNTGAVRYIDYEQDSLTYRLNHWGSTFPGSQILVYEWVESTVPPSKYVASGGNGVPLNQADTAYSTYGYVTQSGAVNVKYYFWVRNKTTINSVAGKLNSVYSIAEAIKNPQSQGIAYATVLRNDTIALYNINQSLTGKNSVLHLGNHSGTAGLIHSEYSLVQEGNPDSLLPISIENKLTDSLVGQDTIGNPVPDPALTPAQAYGIQIRPRQSMFINCELALSNYLTLVNEYLAAYPVVERKIMTTLNSGEPVPVAHSGAYSQTVNTLGELNYIDTNLLSTGYKILVNTDSSQQGKWSIYTWNTPTVGIWNLSQVQTYKTNLYWNYIDWYQTGYDHTVTPDVTVTNNIEFGKLTLQPNTHVRILNNSNNQFVIYYIDSNLNQTLVGIQNGTLQINTGTIPPLELRQIIKAVQNDILIEDLANEYNKLFFTMIKYALTEQKNLEWVFKTSFLSSTQYIRQLSKYPAYIADNQNYYLDYINEVKPYRTILREFKLDYQGNDSFSGDVTDFDLPPYWDKTQQVYRSPDGTSNSDTALLSSGLYNQWTKNYKYQVVNVKLANPGSGYLFPPQITIDGGGGTGATAYSVLDGNGGVGAIIVTNPGSGYTATPTVIINGAGSGAIAYAVLDGVFDGNNIGHNVVRSINTQIKFDRIGYTAANTFVFWNTITSADVGNTYIAANTILVSTDNKFYRLGNNYTVSSTAFPTELVTAVRAGDFDNANDRIIGYNGNIDLALTQTGIGYPGVIVDANTFMGNTYDTTIQSFYGNTLGVNPSDIIVDGGRYVSTFSSHAPEELVPGIMRESLNITVYDSNVAITGANVLRPNIAFREFQDMSGNLQFTRIANANATTLASNLSMTDTTIYVTDASVLSAPNVAFNIPGVVFINGEKITYWRNYATDTKTVWTGNLLLNTGNLISYSGNTYITTGNIYDTTGTFANVAANLQVVTNLNMLTRIRRGVDGTYTPRLHSANLAVVDAGHQQSVPGSTLTSAQLPFDTNYLVTSAVSYGVTLSSPVTGNVGDAISQNITSSPWKPSTVFSTGSIVYYGGYSYRTLGNVYTPYFANVISENNPVWAPSTVITSGMVTYSGSTYIVNGNAYASSFNTVLSNGNLSLAFDGNVGATVVFAGNTSQASQLKLLQNVTDASVIPVTVLGGSIPPLPELFDKIGFDELLFDSVTGSIYINGVDQNSYFVSSYILGTVDVSGHRVIPAGSTVQTGPNWYLPSTTLDTSTTTQAAFLQANPGIYATPGQIS